MTALKTESALRSAMAAAFPSADDWTRSVYHMLEYHLGWRDERLQPQEADGGKLLRPRLCLLACRVVGGDEQQALPLAAAIQLLHDFTLIHDDIQDLSNLRRGRPTVWRLWGPAHGITAGDALCAISHRVLFQMVEAGVTADMALRIARYFDDTLLRITEGQYLDVAFEDRLDLTEDDYLTMIERKTAALIAGALFMGALAGGGCEEATSALAAYGTAFGLAYQIQDDLLGIWGDPAVTGKPVGDDLYQRKKSLPVVYALAHAEVGDQELLRAIYRQADMHEPEVELLLTILERSGARRYAEQTATGYYHTAVASLGRVPGGDTTALGELQALAEGLLGRTK